MLSRVVSNVSRIIWLCYRALPPNTIVSRVQNMKANLRSIGEINRRVLKLFIKDEQFQHYCLHL